MKSLRTRTKICEVNRGVEPRTPAFCSGVRRHPRFSGNSAFQKVHEPTFPATWNIKQAPETFHELIELDKDFLKVRGNEINDMTVAWDENS